MTLSLGILRATDAAAPRRALVLLSVWAGRRCLETLEKRSREEMGHIIRYTAFVEVDSAEAEAIDCVGEKADCQMLEMRCRDSQARQEFYQRKAGSFAILPFVELSLEVFEELEMSWGLR